MAAAAAVATEWTKRVVRWGFAEHSHVLVIFLLCVRHPHFHVNASEKFRTAHNPALAPSVATNAPTVCVCGYYEYSIVDVVVIVTLLPPPSPSIPSFQRSTDREYLLFRCGFSFRQTKVRINLISKMKLPPLVQITYRHTFAFNAVHNPERWSQICVPRGAQLTKWFSKLTFCK